MLTVIVGAGGHGRVALDILRASGQTQVVGFLDADASLVGTKVAGLPVLGSPNQLAKLRQQRIGRAFVAIGDNHARTRYMSLLKEQGISLVNAVHPRAYLSETVQIGQNVMVAAGALVSTDARLADGVIVNTGAIVDHECEVGEAAHLCPGSRLAGRVRVGPRAFIGIGASVIQCLSVGREAIVGAGAVVLEDVPERATVVGVPATVIKVAAESGQNTHAA